MRGIRCRLSADAPWTLCVTAGWSQRVNWEEVDKREGGVNKELGFGRFSIDLHPHQFLKGHQQYSTDKKFSQGQVFGYNGAFPVHTSLTLSILLPMNNSA